MRLICVTGICLILLAACRPAAERPPEVEAAAALPVPVAPPDGAEFVDSDLTLRWEAAPLREDQRYVVRLWYGDQPPREVWTEAPELHAGELIDSFSQPVGAFYWQVAVVNTHADGSFAAMGSEWSAVQSLVRVRRLSLMPLPPDQMSPVARLVHEQGFETAAEQIDFTRDWMFRHTHLGDELDGYRPDYSDAVQAMYDHAQGAAEAPQMWCNGISTAMLTVLRELGIESRLVFLYGEAPGWISEHTVLEVFDPQTQRWHVQDPTNNLYYVDTASGERAAIERMVFGSMAALAGCDGTACNRDSHLAYITPLLGAFHYSPDYSADPAAGPPVWVNPDRLDVSRRVQAFENHNFAEFLAARSSVPVREIRFHFDNWAPPAAESTDPAS